jgi:hypothetical protein
VLSGTRTAGNLPPNSLESSDRDSSSGRCTSAVTRLTNIYQSEGVEMCLRVMFEIALGIEKTECDVPS